MKLSFANHLEMDVEELRFCDNGCVIENFDTPLAFGMESGDLIEVFVNNLT